MKHFARLGLVSAMAEEQRGLLALMREVSRSTHGAREVHRGLLHGQPCACVLSRIGKVAAATTAASLILEHRCDAIVFTGVAGGLKRGVEVGDIVIARELLQHDMDASPIFPRFELPLYGRARLAADAALGDELLDAAPHALRALRDGAHADAIRALVAHTPAVHAGLIASGDRFVSSARESDTLRAALAAAGHEALAVEMEGAALAQVCHDYGVPFAVVRTISDRADDAAHVDFPRFIAEVASRYSVALIDHWLQSRC
jgi:adenosylhomocysteine nucleosidase